MEYTSSSLPAMSLSDSHHSHDLGGMSSDNAQDKKRRSSSRFIKRRRFDDEIVEYSLGGLATSGAAAFSKGSRSRTHSLSNTNQESLSPGISQPPSISNPTPSIIEIIKKRPLPKTHTSGIGFGSHKNRNKKKTGQPPQLTTKDLGRWKPTDDLALVTAVQRVNDMRLIHRGIKFSCRFTVQEIQQRWYALMYDQSVSRVAAAAMRNLQPELIANVQSKTLYTAAEEELLGTIESADIPSIEKFEELLNKNPTVFYFARTPKSLMTYWQLLRLYQLLPDQATIKPSKGETLSTFVEIESMVKATEPSDRGVEEWFEEEMKYTDRKNKREIRQIEDEMVRLQVLVDSVTGMRPPEFDVRTLAILRGRIVRYLMRSKEITIGRKSKHHEVDVDLTLEGPVWKVSRRQGTIRLRNNGDFFISSEGKRPIYVDGRPLLQGNKYKLSHNSSIEIASLKFIFLINHDIVNAVRQETSKPAFWATSFCGSNHRGSKGKASKKGNMFF